MRVLFLNLLMFVAVLSVVAEPTARFSADDFAIECILDAETLYEREAGMVTLTLLSPTQDIAGVAENAPLELNHGEFASVSNVQVLDPPSVRRFRGKRYYAFPLARFVMTVAEKGKYTLQGGAYDVQVAYPVVVRDPFWGNVRTTETKTYRIPVGERSFRVRELPKIGNGEHFSGAVGNFTVRTVVPPGDIIVNEEATAVVEVSGYGTIPEQTLPEYRDAFRGNVKLKSISESRESYIKDGRLVTELRLECTFIPLQREDVRIGEVSFEFFNPRTGDYETVRSLPVEVETKSSVVRRETMEI